MRTASFNKAHRPTQADQARGAAGAITAGCPGAFRVLPSVAFGTLVPTEEEIMATATAPIKVDAETDQLIAHAAHFLQRSKKDVVDAAVREYVEAHRDEIQTGVLDALRSLDGSTKSAVKLLAGLSDAEIDELGGLNH